MQIRLSEEQELSSSNSVPDTFKATGLRRTTISVGVIASHTATGLWFIVSYGTYFEVVGIPKPFESSIIGTGMGFVGVCIDLVLTRKIFGHR